MPESLGRELKIGREGQAYNFLAKIMSEKMDTNAKIYHSLPQRAVSHTRRFAGRKLER